MESKPKHIAMFISDLAGGGAERVMVNLAQGIVNEGCRVDFLVTKREGVYFDLLPKDVNVVDLKGKSTMTSAGKVADYLRRERPQALLSALNQPNTVAVIAKRMAKVPTRVVISIHNTLEEEAKGATSYRNKIMPFFAKRFFPWADNIVAVSEDSANANAKFLRIPRDRFKVILNPVITPLLLESGKQPLDHPWFASGQPPVILGVGRLTRQKNFAMLLEAFAQVRKKMPARLMILGEGEDRADLEAQVASLGLHEDVSMPGFVNNPFQYLAHARVFALSSRWEGLPTVLIESLGVGTPVVSTDCPSGPMEILKGGKYGLLSPVEDAAQFAESLLAELDKPKIAPPAEAYAPYELAPVSREYIKVLLGTEGVAS